MRFLGTSRRGLFDIRSNNAPTSTNYDGGLQFVATFWLRCSGTSKEIRKICLFAPLFEQYVFVNFSTNTAPISTKLARRCQWAPTMLFQWSDESSRAFLGFRLSTDSISEKTVFFDTFFTNWLRGSTLQMLRQAKQSQRVAPLVTALPQALN